MSDEPDGTGRRPTTDPCRRPTRRHLLAAGGTVLAGLLAGCGGGGGGDGGSDPTDEGAPTGTDDPTGTDGTDDSDDGADGGGPGTYTPWPVVGRVPGRTRATPDAAPSTLSEQSTPSPDVRSPPLLTPAGVVVERQDTVALVPPTGGDPVWTRSVRPVDDLVVTEGTVLARTSEGVIGLDRDSGETATEFTLDLTEADTTFASDGGLGYRRDTLSDTAGSGGSELGVRDLGGDVRWENRVEAGFGARRYREPIAAPAAGLLVVCDLYYGKGTFPRPDADHFLRAYDLSDGTERWRVEGVLRPRSVGNGRVLAERYEPRDGGPQKVETLLLDADSGDRLWARQDLPDTTGGFIEDPTVRVADGGDTIYLSGSDRLHALEPADGSTRWTYDAYPDASGGGAAVVVATPDAAVVSTVPELVVLEASDGSVRASRSVSSFAEFLAVGGGRAFAAGPDLGLTVLGG